MPKLKLASAKRRSRIGDFLAVLLLLAVVAGLGWLWWQQRHPHKIAREQSRSAPSPAGKGEAHRVVPSLVLVERKPEAAAAPVTSTNGNPAAAASNAAPVMAGEGMPQALTPPAAAAAEFPHSARDLLQAQIALARRAISPGSIDGAMGSQTRAALAVFQRLEKLAATRALDTNTLSALTLDSPLFTEYTVTSNDVSRLQPLGRTWLAKSQQSALEYENILQLVSEKAHAHPALIERLNPEVVDWAHVPIGTELKIPAVAYPERSDKAAYVVIHLADRYLEAFGTESNLLAHFPCSIAARVDKRPVGELHVAVIVRQPNYTFDPEIFSESAEARAIGHKLVLPPGPKNPVGVAWIGLDKPGYGMHGTPSPEQIGRTESHGCFRLANWDAEYLLKLVWIGMPVYVEP